MILRASSAVSWETNHLDIFQEDRGKRNLPNLKEWKKFEQVFDKGYASGRGALSCMSWLVQSSMEHVHRYDDRGYLDIEKDHLFPAWRHIIVGEFIEESRTQGIIKGVFPP
jgi:hypothetical protein